MKYTEIKNTDGLTSVLDLFESGAKLVSVNYKACSDPSENNDIREAELLFKGKTNFSLNFAEVDCLHIVPIATGSIILKNVALGTFGKIFFFADDEMFDVTNPDTSLSYVISRKLFIGK